MSLRDQGLIRIQNGTVLMNLSQEEGQQGKMDLKLVKPSNL